MRSDRRFPNREELRGKTKDVSFDLVVILDVSGSMSNDEIKQGLVEIKSICKFTGSSFKIIQVDTMVHEVSNFDAKTSTFNRSASGGTFIYPAIQYILDNKMVYDAILVISDMGIEPITQWKTIPRVPLLFLNTSGSDNWDGFQYKNIRNFNIKVT
jgi:predicted metal-dependent peptidase